MPQLLAAIEHKAHFSRQFPLLWSALRLCSNRSEPASTVEKQSVPGLEWFLASSSSSSSSRRRRRPACHIISQSVVCTGGGGGSRPDKRSQRTRSRATLKVCRSGLDDVREEQPTPTTTTVAPDQQQQHSLGHSAQLKQS